MKKFNYKKWMLDHKYSKELILENEDELNTKSSVGLADLFLKFSKEIRAGEYKGIDSGEINELDDLIKNLLIAAEQGSVRTIVQRLDSIISKDLESEPETDNDTKDTPKSGGTVTSTSTSTWDQLKDI
tara:strand:+ start:205 stop:588 length:384 start_codon:yes stop_codon:yes gene_type:complete